MIKKGNINISQDPIYSGNNIDISFSNNSEAGIQKLRNDSLVIVDNGDCEHILKANNLLPSNEHLYNLNLNIKNSRYNISGENQYMPQGVYSSLYDSKGNLVDASICSDFTIKFPTENSIANQTDYESFKNSTGIDIYFQDWLSKYVIITKEYMTIGYIE